LSDERKVMEELVLNAQPREGRGKGAARRVRRNGGVPAVMYGEGENLSLVLDPREFQMLLNTEAGVNALMSLRVEGDADVKRVVMVRDLQSDPVRGEVLHADLLRISMDQEIEVEIPINLEGTPIGVSQNDGYLGQLLSSLTVRCLPTAIPPAIRVDVSGLLIGQVLHVEDLELPEGVTILTETEEAVASVTIVTVEEEAPAEVEEGEEVEAAEGEDEEKGEESESAEEAKEEPSKD
jgi:large subunit ribosomal protein L25